MTKTEVHVEYIALVSLVRVPEWPGDIGLVVLEQDRDPVAPRLTVPHLQVYWTSGGRDDEGGTNELTPGGFLRDYPVDYVDQYVPRVKLVTTDPERIRQWVPVVLEANRWWLGDDAVVRIAGLPVQRLREGTP